MAEESTKKGNKTLGNYVFGKTLGQGTFGKVKAATHSLTGEPVAVKILEKARIIDVADVERVSREIHILKLIRHPNIVQLYEIIETPKYLFLVMEYVKQGELFDYIVDRKRLPEQEACKLFQQLIAGIEYIHKLNIVHRDLKPENLLLDFNDSLKLVDFGLSNTYKKGQLLQTACGSPCYASPEMIKGLQYQGLGTDIWSAGVILFAMVCGYLPFEDPNTTELYEKIKSGKYRLPKTVSQSFKHLLSRILEVNPEERYTIQDIREHKWWNLYQGHQNTTGVIVGYNKIPVDVEVLGQLKALGFDADHAQRSIEANRHNSVTTSYYLLLKKNLKNGKESKADIASTSFDKALLEPQKRRQRVKTLPFDPTDFAQLSELPNETRQRYSSLPRKVPSSRGQVGRRSVNHMDRMRIETSSRHHDLQRDISVGLESALLTRKQNTDSHPSRRRRIDLNRYSFERPERFTTKPDDSPSNNIIASRYREIYKKPLVSKSREKDLSTTKGREKLRSSQKEHDLDSSLIMNKVTINRNALKIKVGERERSITKNMPNTCKHKKHTHYY